MSRIHEALKRARPDAVEDGAASVFKDAWTEEDPPTSQPSSAEAERVEPARVTDGSVARSAAVSDPADPSAGGLLSVKGKSAFALFQGFNPAVIEKIVVTPTVRPAFVEQYRRLAGTLHHAQLERNIRVLMVTSSLAGEGKSLTSTNVALTFSESYHRSVLLVDADLRRPSLHEMFQVPNVSGLGEGLRASQDQKLSLIEVSPRLTLLTAGRPDPDPMSGLTSERMKQLVREASARFDWVIIDTPPVGLLPDANLLAGMVDATLFVIQAGKTPYQVIQRAVAAVGRERIFGVVLNRADESLDTSYSYYSYYQTYGHKRDPK